MRDALPVADRRRAAQTIAMRRFPVPLGEGTIVAGYSPIRSECDPVPLMRSLAGEGRAARAAGRRMRKDKELSFSEWRQGGQLVAGPYGILQPRAEAIRSSSPTSSWSRSTAFDPALPPDRLRRRLLRPHAWRLCGQRKVVDRGRHRFCSARG